MILHSCLDLVPSWPKRYIDADFPLPPLSSTTTTTTSLLSLPKMTATSHLNTPPWFRRSSCLPFAQGVEEGCRVGKGTGALDGGYHLMGVRNAANSPPRRECTHTAGLQDAIARYRPHDTLKLVHRFAIWGFASLKVHLGRRFIRGIACQIGKRFADLSSWGERSTQDPHVPRGITRLVRVGKGHSHVARRILLAVSSSAKRRHQRTTRIPNIITT